MTNIFNALNLFAEYFHGDVFQHLFCALNVIRHHNGHGVTRVKDKCFVFERGQCGDCNQKR